MRSINLHHIIIVIEIRSAAAMAKLVWVTGFTFKPESPSASPWSVPPPPPPLVEEGPGVISDPGAITLGALVPDLVALADPASGDAEGDTINTSVAIARTRIAARFIPEPSPSSAPTKHKMWVVFRTNIEGTPYSVNQFSDSSPSSSGALLYGIPYFSSFL